MSWCFSSYYLLLLPWLLGIELNSRRIGWNYFTQNISHCICWNQFSAVLVGTNSLLFCFPAVLVGTDFQPHWLEPMSCRFGWNCFPQNISLCIGWNQFPAILVGTNSLLFCFSRCNSVCNGVVVWCGAVTGRWVLCGVCVALVQSLCFPLPGRLVLCGVRLVLVQSQFFPL